MIDPRHTYALVVGIEKYEADSLGDLNGPANDAVKFANWLESKDVPRENIFFCLSPLDDNRHVLTVLTNVREGTEQEIRNVITKELFAKEAELLFFFWGGHGVTYQGNELRLFCADAINNDRRNINYTDLQKKMRYDGHSNWPKQIHLIDACANHFEEQSYDKLPSTYFEHENNYYYQNEQFVLLATKSGEYAKNLSEQKTGLFSKEVLALLKEEEDLSWPPNMEQLATKLKERFKALRNSGKAEQTPIYFRCRDWHGNIEEYRQGPTLENEEERFVKALLDLNYKDQVKTFRIFNKIQHHTGAFLIHGKPYNGQRFLLNQLSRYIPLSTEDKVIPINLFRRGLPVSIDFVWHELAQNVRLTGRSSHEYIARHLNKVLANRNVILIINDIGTMPPELLHELLKQFWEPLLKSLGTTNRRERKCLIMFVVDYTGRTTTADIKHTEKVDSKYEPHILIKLKEARAFSENLLKNWFDDNAYRLLPNQLIDQEERILQDILATKKKHGIVPEEALRQVCHSCNYNWYQREKQWFKL